MPIGSLNDYIASNKQVIPFCKTPTAFVTLANGWYSTFDMGGNPGAGVLAGTSTTAGVVPTDATPGVSPILFTTGTGYLATVDFSNTVASRLLLADILWKGGTYAYNSGTTTVTSPPSYAARVPGGTDYTGLQIWIEVSTAFVTGTTWTVVVTYTDQDGNTGATTAAMGTITAANMSKNRMYQLPLASGDSGVRKIESVVVTTGGMTAGAFNVLVLRPIWSGRVAAANQGDCHGIDRTGLPVVFNDSAIALFLNADAALSGLPEVQFEIASA